MEIKILGKRFIPKILGTYMWFVDSHFKEERFSMNNF